MNGFRFAALLILAALAVAAQAAGPTDAVRPGAAKPAAKNRPADKAQGAPRSIAGDLLDDKSASELDNQLLDGQPPAKQPPAKRPAGKSPAATPAAPPADDDAPPVTEGPVLSSGDGDPLHQIGEQMRVLQRRLGALRGDDPKTTELQAQIAEELARLVEHLENQQNSQQSAGNTEQQPSSASERKSVRQPQPAEGQAPSSGKQPVKESTERLGKADSQKPDADEMRGLMKDVWGQLPAREREQMLQSPPEQFLPKYELLLEKYYRRLAEPQRHQP